MKIENPFIIQDNIAKVKGFARRRQEGSEFVVDGLTDRLRSNLSEVRIRYIFWIVIIVMMIILIRLSWMQVIRGGYYGAIAEDNRIRQERIKAERGIIYDRFGNPLVENVPRISLYFIPADLPEENDDRKKLASQISDIIGKNQEEIEVLFEESESYSYIPILIKEDLNHEEAVLFSTVEDALPGVVMKTEFRRQYLEGNGLSHVLGYVGRIDEKELEFYSDINYANNDFIGKDGIELYYEDILRGTDGVREVEVDAWGKPKKILNETKAVMGNSIVLSVDLELQKKITDSLGKAIVKADSRAGAVGVAINPESGEVLALVSLPGFDNNFFSAGIQRDAYHNYLTDPAMPLFNRAISGAYPPGSTFKPIVAMAALEEGLIDEGKTFLSTGGISVGEWFFPDWKYGGHGRINVVKALAESVNTFFYYIGGGASDFEGLGVARITEHAGKFNLGDKLGIDLPGEVGGFLPSKEWKEEKKQEQWYIGDTYHLAIGQGDILVTPLQVAVYTSTIANGGTLYRPHLLKENDYIIRDNFLNSDNIEIVRRGLRATVLGGSARSLQSLSVSVAGKTGTAQVGGDKETHAWFTGFAPYENPKIALTVLIEHGGGGDRVAVPVFREVIQWYFSDR